MGLLAMLAIPAYAALQVHVLARWRGRWRLAALVPLLAMVPVLAVTVRLYAQDSNLWPLALILASAVAALVLLLTGATRRALAG